MWTEWCIDSPAGYPVDVWVWHAGGAVPAEAAPADDGGWIDDGWSLGAAALLGIAAYEGVRRFLGRGQRAPIARASDPSPPREALLESPAGDGLSNEPRADREAQAADPLLIDDLVSLHDLASTDAMRRRIVRSLARAGVVPVSSVGTRFNEQQHDVMGTLVAAADTPPGTVVEVLRPGFVDATGRVLRPAQVVVATDEDGAW